MKYFYKLLYCDVKKSTCEDLSRAYYGILGKASFDNIKKFRTRSFN